MLNSKLAAGLVASTAVGGYAIYRYIKLQKELSAKPLKQVAVLPVELTKIAPEVIYEIPSRPMNSRPKSIMDLASNLKESVRAALNSATHSVRVMALSNLAAFAFAS